jgi:hypothetical protein
MSYWFIVGTAKIGTSRIFAERILVTAIGLIRRRLSQDARIRQKLDATGYIVQKLEKNGKIR